MKEINSRTANNKNCSFEEWEDFAHELYVHMKWREYPSNETLKRYYDEGYSPMYALETYLGFE